uniref:Serine incorporator 2 n=1 Tax=Serinus canaria TaxID=9135 RepID=A0A8C9UGM3_SERCA
MDIFGVLFLGCCCCMGVFVVLLLYGCIWGAVFGVLLLYGCIWGAVAVWVYLGRCFWGAVAVWVYLGCCCCMGVFGALFLGCCCCMGVFVVLLLCGCIWGAVFGVLLLFGCIWGAVFGVLLLFGCIWGPCAPSLVPFWPCSPGPWAGGMGAALTRASPAEVSCLCGSAPCLLCGCCPSAKNSTISRLLFTFFLFLGTLVSIIMIIPGVEKELHKLPGFCEGSGSVLGVQTNVDCSSFLGHKAVYRMGFAMAAFFCLFAVLMVCVRSSKDPRAALQNGFWFFKFLALVGITVGAFYIPDGTFTSVWFYFGVVGSFLFILIQLVLLIDFAHSWSQRWLHNAEQGSAKGWYAALCTITFLFYAASIAAVVLLYVYYTKPEGCTEGKAFISINLILCLIVSVVSILPKIQVRHLGAHRSTQGCVTPRVQEHPGLCHPRYRSTQGCVTPQVQEQPGLCHPGVQEHPTAGAVSPMVQEQPGLCHPGVQEHPTVGAVSPMVQEQPGGLGCVTPGYRSSQGCVTLGYRSIWGCVTHGTGALR